MGGDGRLGHIGIDLKVADWEFLHAEHLLIVYLDHLITAGRHFANTMIAVGEEALFDQQGGIADSCKVLGQTMVPVLNSLTGLRESIKSNADTYIAKLDEIDQLLY